MGNTFHRQNCHNYITFQFPNVYKVQLKEEVQVLQASIKKMFYIQQIFFVC